ncbi:hypothetical protein CcrSwift_gp252 [Caulobacter phage CcrSwift]|uniref:Uncharacterized protein n=1 Tax=Caulobacter phage CcrSwift TaxID=2927984 RepID=K4JVX7_9CAUD|nr:hypothetical protein D870_gp169 [Caulobacter phage CcrSwift]AFU88570.1 hypothetical protein CcrSwift_gp252 [Caulobacter phage CcrSwift]
MDRNDPAKPLCKIAVLAGPLWEVDTDNCETLLVPVKDVPHPCAENFQDEIDMAFNMSGEAMDWRRVEGYAAVLRDPRGADMSPVEGPFATAEEAFAYVKDQWSDRIPGSMGLAPYEAPQ